MQKVIISYFHFNYRSVFVAAVSRILKGERDYGEPTLATPTLQISHIVRGVVNMLLVRVEVQCANDMSLSEIWKSCLCIHQKHICAQLKIQIMHFIVL